MRNRQTSARSPARGAACLVALLLAVPGVLHAQEEVPAPVTEEPAPPAVVPAPLEEPPPPVLAPETPPPAAAVPAAPPRPAAPVPHAAGGSGSVAPRVLKEAVLVGVPAALVAGDLALGLGGLTLGLLSSAAALAIWENTYGLDRDPQRAGALNGAFVGGWVTALVSPLLALPLALGIAGVSVLVFFLAHGGTLPRLPEGLGPTAGPQKYRREVF